MMYWRPSRSWIGLLTLVGVSVGAWLLTFNAAQPTSTSSGQIEIAGATWDLVGVARTPAERTRGLNAFPELPHQHGLLFLFETKGEHTFWMGGVKFPIDIIFIDGDRVDSVVRNFSPEDRSMVAPAGQADRVLEVHAHEARTIEPGDSVSVRLSTP